jgi:HAD superfamily hydrolase (TIGR01509 family)
MQLPPDFVIFDCDGVVVDSETVTNRILRDDLATRGLELSLERIVDLFVGGTIAGVCDTARKMGADMPEDWVDYIYPEMFKALAEEVTAVPGIETVLDALDRAGIGYAIGSNGPHAKMDVTLTRTGLAPRFKGRIYSREDVANPKPAPDVYLKAAADAGVDPSRCVVVEDSPSGARAGKAAGMHVMGYVATHPEEKIAPHCDATFHDMKDFAALLAV